MREEITTTDNRLHDEVRIFAGVSALGVSSALVYCMKVGIAKVGNAKVMTKHYSDVSFPSRYSVQKVKGVVGECQYT